MGLDLLPQRNTITTTTTTTTTHSNSRPRPKSPPKDSILRTRSKNRFSDDDIGIAARSSSARKSDFEYHRLSLQINKENRKEAESPILEKIGGKIENTNPARHFAKQVVNEVKMKGNRPRAGLLHDITNTHYRDREEILIRKDQNLALFRENNGRRNMVTTGSGTQSSRNWTFSHCDSNYDKSRGVLRDEKKHENMSSGEVKFQLAPQTSDYLQESEANQLPDNGKKKRRRRKANKSNQPVSSEGVNVRGPTVVPAKKNHSPPATKLPSKKKNKQSQAVASKRTTQFSRSPGPSYNHLPLQPDQNPTVLPVPDLHNGCAAAPEYRDYIQKILKCAGVSDGFISSAFVGKRHTATHLLDSSIFYYLELVGGDRGILRRRCNRKLIFQLVDELLAEILMPQLDYKPCANFNGIAVENLDLCAELCRRIGDFPAADCRVRDDIDSLIKRDLERSKFNNGFWKDEIERVVCKIEGEITEWLVSEMTAVSCDGDTEKE